MNRLQAAIALFDAIVVKTFRFPVTFGNMFRGVQKMLNANRKLFGFLPQIFQITLRKKRHGVKIEIRILLDPSLRSG
jgi:hypothetical protein